MAQKAARAFRDSRLVTLPDAGHVAMMEYPETVAMAFRELLDDAGESGTRRARQARGATCAAEPGRADAGEEAVDEERTDESMGG